jgi:hypothetical protein
MKKDKAYKQKVQDYLESIKAKVKSTDNLVTMAKRL